VNTFSTPTPFVDTYRCAHNGQHPYLLAIRPDGHEMTLTLQELENAVRPLTNVEFIKARAGFSEFEIVMDERRFVQN
jgi:hypothetical protein